MKRTLLTVCSLALTLMMGLVYLPTGTVHAAQFANSAQQAGAENQVPLSLLGMPSNEYLQGPLDKLTLTFSLPPDWQLTSPGTLQLELTSTFTSLIIAENPINLDHIIAGRLDVTFNGVSLDTTLLQGSGERSLSLALPPLPPDPLTGLYTLAIQWDAGASCDQNVATSLAIRNTSMLILPHQVVPVPLALGQYPLPFYQVNPAFPISVSLVIPDSPTREELQGAVAIATSLGRLTHGNLRLGLIPASQLSAETNGDQNLILVGKSGAFSILQGENVAAPANGEGFIQMLSSPYHPGRALLLISGASDTAVLNAATALSSGKIITGSDPGLALVGAAPLLTSEPFSQDQTFTDLGQDQMTFSDFGSTQREVLFYIPAGTSIGADAYLDLVLNHSELIDYLRSGVVVRVNEVPVGSVRLSDTTANLNSVRLILPASAIRPGTNHLEIQVDLVPRNICSDPRRGSLWVAIFPDTLLHLPVGGLTVVTPPTPSLGNYPQPFTNRSLDHTTLVLSASDPQAWSAAALIAYDLGANDGGSPLSPQVLLADPLSALNFSTQNLIVVGNLTHLPVIQSLVSILPAPFENGSLAAGVQTLLGYQIDPAQSLGYLEQAPFAADPQIALLLVLGSNDEGTNWALDALKTPNLRAKLAGANFALVQGSNILAQNLQALAATTQPPSIPGLTPEASSAATPAPGGLPTTLPPRQDLWLVPALVVSGILLVILILAEILAAFRRKK
jgi:cellulose synthase operon protein B